MNLGAAFPSGRWETAFGLGKVYGGRICTARGISRARLGRAGVCSGGYVNRPFRLEMTVDEIGEDVFEEPFVVVLSGAERVEARRIEF